MTPDATDPAPAGDFTIPRRERLAALLNEIPLPGVSFEPSRTVLLTGSPRSGTTWAGDLLTASRSACLVNEPLHPKLWRARRAGLGWRPYADPDAPWPEGRRCFDALFRGKGLSVKLLLRNRLNPWPCRYLVLKAVRATRLLPWLQRRYALRGWLLLVRHPCAVVSSQMLNFRLTGLTWEDDLSYVRRRLPEILDYVRGLRTEEERRTLAWSLDQHAALTGARADLTRIVRYERLVAYGPEELRDLLGSLGLPTPGADETRSALRRNSRQASASSLDHARASIGERVGVWTERLEPGQVDRILAVVEALGIRGYGPDPTDLAPLEVTGPGLHPPSDGGSPARLRPAGR